MKLKLTNDTPEIYKNRFEGYQFRLNLPGEEPYDPENEAVDVRLLTQDGLEYESNFVARKFLDTMFEKDKRTGECAQGTYFAMPNMIIVNRVDESTVRKTIDAMIENLEIDIYFTPIH